MGDRWEVPTIERLTRLLCIVGKAAKDLWSDLHLPPDFH